MKYLLDTCVVSDFIKGDKNTLQHIKHNTPSDIAITTITMMEIQYGLQLNAAIAKKIRPILRDFLQPIHILDFNQDDAYHAAMVRGLLKLAGTPIGSYDVLLAGMALSRKLTLITSNTKEFARVDGVVLGDWRV